MKRIAYYMAYCSVSLRKGGVERAPPAELGPNFGNHDRDDKPCLLGGAFRVTTTWVLEYDDGDHDDG